MYIKFLHPKAIEDSEGTAVSDLEVTVVHELLHVRFVHCHPHSRKFNPHIEQAIETTATAMVAAKRNVSIKEIK